MYEWESEVGADAISSRIHWLEAEIKRIANVTLRGDFANESDRSYWCERMKRLNGELLALQQVAA